MAIPYLHGYLVKPASISYEGYVTFTDGTNNITPNQQQCEAYGYKYNKVTGTCSAFHINNNLEQSLNNQNNKIQGTNNATETGTNNTTIIGENNTVRGTCRNNIVSGFKNEIQNNINNNAVFGVGGDGVFDSAMIFGGNNSTDRVGTRQTITLMYGGQTTNNSTVDIHPNNGAALTFFQPQVNRVYYFQSETLAVRVGGSSGSGAVGDFKSWVERGVVKCNNVGTLSIDRSRTSPADSGTTTGWGPTNAVSGANFQQTVKGATNMTIEWVSTIRFMQLWTGVSLP
tara:strand:- start:218 stop:1072 length:855 start_codon:yes stop_codon:yes gene_type:complete